MEVKRRTARLLVRKLINGSSEGDEAATDEAIAEIRLLSKHDDEFRPLLVDAGAVPLLAHHLLLFSGGSGDAAGHRSSSHEDAAAALLNLSISSREALMATPGLLDGLAAALRSPAAPAAAQHAAATVYSLLSVEAYRPIIGGKEEIIAALCAMLRPIAPPHPNPTKSLKDALKALFAVALCKLNRAVIVRQSAVPALFSLIVNDGRTGIVEDCTAVVAQVAGCGESLEAFRRVSGVQVLVDLVDAATGTTARARENAAAALLNLAESGGERAIEDIREVETAVAAVRELAESTSSSQRARTKAAALLGLLVRRPQQLEEEDWRASERVAGPPAAAAAF
ncbi:unnamed protein product [Spirodela intermedia]|uniref:U-box domain-containing protein n=1 Tax=Spirodela intermedia TaxID=51605 RepID=A0A7I8L9H7_SPIIN|nr:unnamed protein product [Spirodela intermedia]